MKRIGVLLLVVCILGLWGIDHFTNSKTETTVIGGKMYEVVKREVDTLVVPVTKVVYRPGKDIHHDRPVYVEVVGPVDTAAIIAKYNSLQPVVDTLTLDDGLGMVVVTDTLFQNRLRSRVWFSEVKRTTITERVYLKEPARAQLWLGALAAPVPSVVVGYVPKARSRLVLEAGIGAGGRVALGAKYRLR